jgi:uncharacterized membrane protein YbjE (DUF340 family)
MSIQILLSVILGILTGIFVFPTQYIGYINIFIEIGLCLLLFFVGIDIGRGGETLKSMKKYGAIVILVPLAVGLGSIFGSILIGYLFRMPFNESGAVGAGFGWYSWSALYLQSEYSVELGVVALITNVFREIIALITIPLVAKYIGKLEAIAPAGATAMDTALPVISRSTDGEIAVISFVTGVVLSLSVPFLVPFIVNLA